MEDDEKDDLDAKEILDGLKKGNKKENEQRLGRDLPLLLLMGWAKEPKYNEKTNNLEWVLKLKGQDEDSSHFCPRCHAQFLRAVAECPDCPHVVTVSFAATSK